MTEGIAYMVDAAWDAWVEARGKIDQRILNGLGQSSAVREATPYVVNAVRIVDKECEHGSFRPPAWFDGADSSWLEGLSRGFAWPAARLMAKAAAVAASRGSEEFVAVPFSPNDGDDRTESLERLVNHVYNDARSSFADVASISDAAVALADAASALASAALDCMESEGRPM